MANEWIKPGTRVYIVSLINLIRNGYTTIDRVEGDYCYLSKDHRIKINIHTLDGDFLDFHNVCFYNVCHLCQTKEDIKPNFDYNKKCKIIKDKLHLLSEQEIDEIYDNIINKDKNELLR